MIHESSSFLKCGNKLQSIRMRHFTTWLNSHRVASCANRLPAWRIDNGGNDLCWFDWLESNQPHFQPTLHSPPEVKIDGIMIHESSSFLKRGNKLQSIRIRYFTTRLDSHGVVSRENQLPAWRVNNRGNNSCQFVARNFSWLVRFMSIRSSRVESTTLLTHPTLSWGAIFSCANRLPACRIDSRGNDLCQFNWINSNRQHFQPILKAQISFIL